MKGDARMTTTETPRREPGDDEPKYEMTYVPQWEPTGKIIFHRPGRPGDWRITLTTGDDVGMQWEGGDIVAFADELLAEVDPTIHVDGSHLFIGPFRLTVLGHDAYRSCLFCQRDPLSMPLKRDAADTKEGTDK